MNTENRELLSERERIILRSLIEAHVEDSGPVGSRTIARRYGLGMSPATIRNSMADLEEKGYLHQPHTSAGRVPTDKGYRYYVDELMAMRDLADADRAALLERFRASLREGDLENILDQVVQVVADLSSQLGLALSPHFEMGILQKMEMVSLSEKKLLIVLSIRSGLVKTIVMEVDAAVSASKLAETGRLLNERLYGLSIEEIRKTIRERVHMASKGDPRLLRVIVDEADALFDFSRRDELHLGGATNVFLQPEFADRENLTDLMGLLERRDTIAHMLSQRLDYRGIDITIGRENPSEEMRMCSLLTTSYRVGNAVGIIGLIGPTRMPYSRLVGLLSHMSELTGALLVV